MDKLKAQIKNLPTLFHLSQVDKMLIETYVSHEYCGTVLKAKIDYKNE